ncbi:Uncharacterized protein dnm_037050 [Desulfonema magnum]|uniref:Uncharacterized protein n=1 Tax=Desulfonema magnum TaxID=45655 RepID=A0A975GN73_9BACT|nr:Uncharacterized protein dnm_037050 [Desulfonema magnum]
MCVFVSSCLCGIFINIVRHDFCIAGRKCPAFPHFGEIVSEKRPADISGFQFSGYMNSVSYKCMQKSCRTVLHFYIVRYKKFDHRVINNFFQIFLLNI